MKKLNLSLFAFMLVLAVMLSSCTQIKPSQSESPYVCVSDTVHTDTGISTEAVVTDTDNSLPNIPDTEQYEYTLVFSDEFDGSQLNSSYWKYRTDEKAGGVNLSSNVDVKDGYLRIKFGREGDKYSGGGIISKQLFGYGYYETKCTLFADGGGLHSAFWLMGGSGDGKTLPKENLVFEIDGFEFDSNKPEEIQYNLNYKVGKKYGLIHRESVQSLSGREVVCGFEWLPDRVNWYLDGELVHTVTDDEVPLFYAQQAVWLTALANTTMSGKTDDSLLPVYTYFDYFRFYARQSKDANLIGAGEFEYNSNIDFTSSVDMQSPIGFCESGDIDCSFIEKRSDAYGGSCVLVHESKKKEMFEVCTYQNLTNIPNGVYTLSFKAKKAGSFKSIRVNANYGSEDDDKGFVTDLIGGEWTEIKIDNVNITQNKASIGICSVSDGDGVLYIDNISFYANVGADTGTALHYPYSIREGQRIGGYLYDAKSAGFSTSSGWKTSSIVGVNYASKYKLNATDSDYAAWSFVSKTEGKVDISVYNIESQGKVQQQMVSLYKGGTLAASFKCGAVSGWEDLGEAELVYGQKYEIRIENTKGNRTMRADSVRLIPKSTPLYSECVIMNTKIPRAYVFGKMASENTVPLPCVISDKLYLPKEWTQKQLGLTIGGTAIDINGIEYVSAEELNAENYSCVYFSSGAVVIYPADKCKDTSVLSAVSELF